MTRTGDQEISVISGRLLDNPGELADMYSAIYLILAFNTGKKGGLQMFTGFTYLPESTHVQISPKKKKDVK